MDNRPPTPDILLTLQRQNENLRHAIDALTENASESRRMIEALTHENDRLASTTPRTPLLLRIGDRTPHNERRPPITFPTISNVPVIHEPTAKIPLMERILPLQPLLQQMDPPPPQLPPRVGPVRRTRGGDPTSRGEGLRAEPQSFAWSAHQWRTRDKQQKRMLQGVRRNEEEELDIGDLYTYSFIMRALHGQDTRKNTPRRCQEYG